jgi:hypothetical protein
MTAAVSNLADAIQLDLEVIAAPVTPDVDSATTNLDGLAAKIRRTFPELGAIRK